MDVEFNMIESGITKPQENGFLCQQNHLIEVVLKKTRSLLSQNTQCHHTVEVLQSTTLHLEIPEIPEITALMLLLLWLLLVLLLFFATFTRILFGLSGFPFSQPSNDLQYRKKNDVEIGHP